MIPSEFLLYTIRLRLQPLLLFLVVSFQALSQAQIANNRYTRFSGRVIDSATSQSIPQAYIWTHHYSTMSNDDGSFSLRVKPTDTIHVSHVSYHDLTIIYDTLLGNLKVQIPLKQKIRMLEEVRIYSYLSESAFKRKIMETTRVLSLEEEIAMTNSKIISYLAKYAPAYPMNDYDNYTDYMKGPQGVVIFSNQPNKGLIRAIKSVIKPNIPSYQRFLRTDSSKIYSRFR